MKWPWVSVNAAGCRMRWRAVDNYGTLEAEMWRNGKWDQLTPDELAAFRVGAAVGGVAVSA